MIYGDALASGDPGSQADDMRCRRGATHAEFGNVGVEGIRSEPIAPALKDSGESGA